MGNHSRLTSVFGPAFVNSGALTLALNGTKAGGFAPVWVAYGIFLPEAKTLNEVLIRINAVTGTLAAGDLQLDVYSDASGPSASLSSTTTLTATPTGAAWIEFTGLSQALSAHTQYWLVLRNKDSVTANGVAIVNSATVYYSGSAAGLFSPALSATGSGTWFGWAVKTSANSGSSWTNSVSASNIRLKFSDGSYDGFPFYSFATAVASGERAFGSPNNVEPGVKFTTPLNCNLKIIGAALYVAKTGTPTGNLSYKFYTGLSTTATAQTQTIPPLTSTLSTGTLLPLYFSSPQTLSGGVNYRVTINNSAAGDTGSNAYIMQYHLIENSPASKLLVPYMTQLTVLSGASPAWADADTKFVNFGLILDTDGEFAAGARPELRGSNL